MIFLQSNRMSDPAIAKSCVMFKFNNLSDIIEWIWKENMDNTFEFSRPKNVTIVSAVIVLLLIIIRNAV